MIVFLGGITSTSCRMPSITSISTETIHLRTSSSAAIHKIICMQIVCRSNPIFALVPLFFNRRFIGLTLHPDTRKNCVPDSVQDSITTPIPVKCQDLQLQVSLLPNHCKSMFNVIILNETSTKLILSEKQNILKCNIADKAMGL